MSKTIFSEFNARAVSREYRVIYENKNNHMESFFIETKIKLSKINMADKKLPSGDYLKFIIFKKFYILNFVLIKFKTCSKTKQVIH